jgi:hypothetical protein
MLLLVLLAKPMMVVTPEWQSRKRREPPRRDVTKMIATKKPVFVAVWTTVLISRLGSPFVARDLD